MPSYQLAREKLLDTLKTDLLKISQANGYVNTVKSVYRGVITIEEVPETEFPAIAYFYNDEVRTQPYESGDYFDASSELIVLMFVRGKVSLDLESDVNSKLCESAVRDLLYYFNKFRELQDAVTTSIGNGHNLARWFVSRINSRFDSVKASAKFAVAIQVTLLGKDYNKKQTILQI